MSRSSKNSPLDFFSTPPLTTLALFTTGINFNHSIFEPACGTGAISEIVSQFGYDVLSKDVHNYGYEYHASSENFLETTEPKGRYDIITNPPYSIHLQWIEKSLQMAKRYVALLFPLVYLPPANKREFYTNSYGFEVYLLGWRSKFIMPGQTEPSGMKDYAWFVWDKTKKPNNSFPMTIIEKSDVLDFAEDNNIIL